MGRVLPRPKHRARPLNLIVSQHMTPHSAPTRFKQRLGQDEASLLPSQGIDQMLAFFRDERIDGCSSENQDMLLYQWGTYDWGKGEWFELNVTRQLIVGAGEDEDIWQLSLTFRYPPAQPLREVPDGSHWCTKVSELPEFVAFIKQTPAYRMVAANAPASVELRYECAG